MCVSINLLLAKTLKESINNLRDVQRDGRVAVVGSSGLVEKKRKKGEGTQKRMQQENMVEDSKKKVTLLFIQLFVTSSKLKF